MNAKIGATQLAARLVSDCKCIGLHGTGMPGVDHCPKTVAKAIAQGAT
jgi:hypothetical protein